MTKIGASAFRDITQFMLGCLVVYIILRQSKLGLGGH